MSSESPTDQVMEMVLAGFPACVVAPRLKDFSSYARQSLLCTPAVQSIVTRCLHKSPGDRFPSMTQVKDALLAAASGVLKALPAQAQPSIAVLPFANMSVDKEREYFSDGLAEEIINALAQHPGLKVTARTSAFAFRHPQDR